MCCLHYFLEKSSKVSMTAMMECNCSNGCTGFEGKKSILTLKKWDSKALIEGRTLTPKKVTLRQGPKTIRLLYKNARLKTLESQCRVGKGEQIEKTNYKYCSKLLYEESFIVYLLIMQMIII